MTHDDDDKELFRQAVAGAKRLEHDRREPVPAPPDPRAAFRRADERAVMAESLIHQAADLDVESGDEILYRRRGRFTIEDELDLHGLVAAEARHAVREFLAESLARRRACVRIIHGKGRGSGPRGPVLKKSVNLWLRKHDSVLAFCSARAPHGGTGAIYVLLAR
jgi:DNA-nicking Smr family endonuclease